MRRRKGRRRRRKEGGTGEKGQRREGERKREGRGRIQLPQRTLMVNPPRHSICQPEISRSLFFFFIFLIFIEL